MAPSRAALALYFVLGGCGGPPVGNGGPDAPGGDDGGTAGDASPPPRDLAGDMTPPPCQLDPVEPIESGTYTRIKSPAQQMTFTAGLPFRILADASDVNAWQCPPGHPPYVCPGSEVRFLVDGTVAGAVP